MTAVKSRHVIQTIQDIQPDEVLKAHPNNGGQIQQTANLRDQVFLQQVNESEIRSGIYVQHTIACTMYLTPCQSNHTHTGWR